MPQADDAIERRLPPLARGHLEILLAAGFRQIDLRVVVAKEGQAIEQLAPRDAVAAVDEHEVRSSDRPAAIDPRVVVAVLDLGKRSLSVVAGGSIGLKHN